MGTDYKKSQKKKNIVIFFNKKTNAHISNRTYFCSNKQIILGKMISNPNGGISNFDNILFSTL